MTNAQSVLQCTLCTSFRPAAMLCSLQNTQKYNASIFFPDKYTKVHQVHCRFFTRLVVIFFQLITEKVIKSSEYMYISEQYRAFRQFLPCAFLPVFIGRPGQCTLKIGKYTKVHGLEG